MNFEDLKKRQQEEDFSQRKTAMEFANRLKITDSDGMDKSHTPETLIKATKTILEYLKTGK